jgi:hypothetical protein
MTAVVPQVSCNPASYSSCGAVFTLRRMKAASSHDSLAVRFRSLTGMNEAEAADAARNLSRFITLLARIDNESQKEVDDSSRLAQRTVIQSCQRPSAKGRKR